MTAATSFPSACNTLNELSSCRMYPVWDTGFLCLCDIQDWFITRIVTFCAICFQRNKIYFSSFRYPVPIFRIKLFSSQYCNHGLLFTYSLLFSCLQSISCVFCQTCSERTVTILDLLKESLPNQKVSGCCFHT